MQEKETFKADELTEIFRAPRRGRLLALDLGTKKVGVAVSDELQFTTRRVAIIERQSWKKFLKRIIALLAEFDAVGLVIGLPYNFDGTESEMSAAARRVARNFSLSLKIPVCLQDERVSTYEARANLWEQGMNEKQMRENLDSEAAAIILSDFIERRNRAL